MKKKLILKNKVFVYFLALFFLALFSFGIYSLVTGILSLSKVEGWDGQSVSTEFSLGNGTEENPYIIQDAPDYMYFKSVIEGENWETYQDKYFALNDDIDFGRNAITPIGTVVGEEERIFKGHLDGRGFALTNFIMNESVIQKTTYYGLFTKVENATIQSLGIRDYRIKVEKDDNTKIVSSLVGEIVGDSTSLKNLYFDQFYIDASNASSDNSTVGLLIGTVYEKAMIQNVYVDGTFSGNNHLSAHFLSYLEVEEETENEEEVTVEEESTPSVTNVITRIKVVNMNDENLSYEELEEYYVYRDEAFYRGEERVAIETILSFLNDEIGDDYYWAIDEGVLGIHQYEKVVEPTSDDGTQTFTFSIRSSPDISLHATGVEGTTVYINDLDADYYYYMGLNYTHSSNGTLPSGNNQNLYDNTNLAQVYIAYLGHPDYDTSIVAKVSPDDNYSDFIYYKYYPIVNGKITIPLIDNPYASRPTNKAFNGWYTDYQGAELSFDLGIYQRSVTIPANGTGPYSITMYSSWTEVTQITASVNSSYNLSTTGLKDAKMYPMAEDVETFSEPVPAIYTRHTINSGTNYNGVRYPNGAVSQNGSSLNNSYCRPEGSWWNGYTAVDCVYYLPVANADRIFGNWYYALVNGTMTAYQMPYPTYVYTSIVPVGTNMASYYRKVDLTNGQSYAGLYDQYGSYKSSGTCSGTCTYYDLVQYDDGLVLADHDVSFYYLVTRDTNIALVTSNINGFINDKPVTVTGLHNNTNNSTNRIRLDNRRIYANADLRVEYVQLYTENYSTDTSGPSSSNTNYVYGNFYNVKIGRGQTTRTGTTGGYGGGTRTFYNAKSVIAGGDSGTGSAGSPTRYHLIVESGYYNHMSGIGTTSASGNYYTAGYATYGCDYDRARNINTNLTVYYTIAGTWGGTIRGYNNSYNTTNFLSATVKSGTIGQATSESASGIYVGGLNGGSIYAPASLTVEGGDLLYINGGPLVDSSVASYNLDYIYFKGGEADFIFGGAARSLTHGNRIISATGGTVLYAIHGGSNGYNGNDNSDTNRGTLNGSTLLYIGGKVTVGGGTNAQFNATAGTVFGAGNGNSSSTQIGSVNNSIVIVADQANIQSNVYGGGNYGAVNSRSSNNSTTTIKVLGGTIQGSVYGGGNNNKMTSTSVTTAIGIDVSGGTIQGSVYGGFRTHGTVFGSTNVVINGGTIENDVYGGGEGGYTQSNNNSTPGTYVRDNVAVTVNNGTVKGSVYGGSAYGTVNAANQNTNTTSATTTVTVNGGTVQNSVFGGAKGSASYTPKVVGDITVNINGGSVGKVFGGFDAAGEPNAGDVVYLTGGTVGNAFGGGNNTGQTTTDIRLQGSNITGALYGGSNVLGDVTTTNIRVTSGSTVDIYGGNNLGGSAATTNVTVTGGTVTGDIYGGGNEAGSTTSNITITGTTVNDVYGGCKKASLTTSHVDITNSTTNDVFGGSNVNGTVTTSNVNMTGSNAHSVYGGNNAGGQTVTTNVEINSTNATNVFGGGDNATSGESNVTINGGTIGNVYGGGNEAGLTTSNVTITDGTITKVFGGSNTSGNITTSNVILGVPTAGTPDISLDIQVDKRAPGYYPQSNKPTYATITVTLTNNTDQDIRDWEVELNVPNSEIFANYSSTIITITGDTFAFDSVNRYSGYNSLTANGGTYNFQFEILSDTPLADFAVTGEVLGQNNSTSGGTSGGTIQIGSLYGGNNLGGVTTSTNITGYDGTVGSIFGGGKSAAVGETSVILENVTATDIYGGGDAAGVSGDTLLDLDNCTVSNNIYGGGNEGIVQGSTEVFVTDTHVSGNAFAGGNGSTAVVYGNSTITMDGASEIGTSTSVAPDDGCIFGSGNAASTGRQTTNNSVATVNIVGGLVHGNVYGGPKMAVVYGTTDTNIGTAAVNDNSLTEDDIVITGTVFGGGESNASGSETYDWTFISVTQGITVDIDGTGYLTHNHEFAIHGSIFGSGNASSSEGTSEITIKNLGTIAEPNRSISIQRANLLTIDSSVIELVGTTDRTNEYSDILYSFNIIDKLILKNNATIMLQHNANLLKEFYSGVDGNNGLEPATVEIHDDTKTVVRNVDNRVYMLPGQNLNITINQAATAYGKVTGMTFFGMYVPHDNGTYRLGLYAPTYDYNSNANSSLEIVGGSYVIGLHHTDHDITVDGFYSNYLDETTRTKIVTAYIDPTPIGSTGYRWVVGFEAINYEITLTASKYSSLGTYELQLIDFANGDTIFSVTGFDSSGLNREISLVEPTSVPRVGRTESEANNILGLAMKTETQEWTAYGTTKMYSAGGGDISGTREYRTDSRQLPPSLMFYLYHAKNISSQENLGSSVLTIEAAIPKNQIDYEIKYITITINIVSRQYADADSYDASITYDKRYEMPSNTSVNITNMSQFTAYFSLIAWSETFAGVYGRNNTNFHTLVTDYPLPVNTMITMLDYGANPTRPNYYYMKVDQTMYNASTEQLRLYNEVTYPLSSFIKMDSTSTNNTYQDSVANQIYYDADAGLVDEEFIFIFDFKECSQVTGDHLENSILFELRTAEDRTVFNVLGIREGLMVYNTYESSNVVLQQTIENTESYLYYNIPDDLNYSTQIRYDETENRQSVIDTNYESSSMGLNIIFLDRNDEQVSSSLLIGTYFKIDNVQHFADGDGVFRIKLAGKVSNLIRNASLMVYKNLPAGQYTIRYTLFASDDGLHNSDPANSVSREFQVTVVSSDNAIVSSCQNYTKIVDGDTGMNMNNSVVNTYTVEYRSVLSNPNFRIEVYKRALTNASTVEYASVAFNTLFKTSLSPATGNEVYIQMGNQASKNFDFQLQDNLTSGTYRVVFKLYDNNQLIDSDEQYVIVHKKLQ